MTIPLKNLSQLGEGFTVPDTCVECSHLLQRECRSRRSHRTRTALLILVLVGLLSEEPFELDLLWRFVSLTELLSELVER
jgi:hypothetical protein